jgi:hypothetical protein
MHVGGDRDDEGVERRTGGEHNLPEPEHLFGPLDGILGEESSVARCVSQSVKRLRAVSSKGCQPRYTRMRCNCSVSVATRSGRSPNKTSGRSSCRAR